MESQNITQKPEEQKGRKYSEEMKRETNSEKKNVQYSKEIETQQSFKRHWGSSKDEIRNDLAWCAAPQR